MKVLKRMTVTALVAVLAFGSPSGVLVARAQEPEHTQLDAVGEKLADRVGEFADDIGKTVGGKFTEFMNSLDWKGLGNLSKTFADEMGILVNEALESAKAQISSAVADALEDAAANFRGKGLWQNALAGILENAAEGLRPELPAEDVVKETPSPETAGSSGEQPVSVEPERTIDLP